MNDDLPIPPSEDRQNRDFYLVEYKALRDEFAAATLRSNNNYIFAITPSALIVGLATHSTFSAKAMVFALLISIVLTSGLFAKTLTQNGREGVGIRYLRHLSKKLSGSRSLNEKPLDWESALQDDGYVNQPEERRPIGLFDQLSGFNLNWWALIIVQVLALVIILTVHAHLDWHE